MSRPLVPLVSTPLVLDLLPSWRQDSLGDVQRRAACGTPARRGADPALPRQQDRSVFEQAVADACREFDDEQVSALQWAIVLINAYNRISIGSSHPPIRK
jgi:alkylhydroperoxidase family enzyme